LNEGAPLRLQIDGFASKTARHYQLTARNVLHQEPNISMKANVLEVTLPPQSLNLFVLDKAGF
jgi:hypothetical protein